MRSAQRQIKNDSRRPRTLRAWLWPVALTILLSLQGIAVFAEPQRTVVPSNHANPEAALRPPSNINQPPPWLSQLGLSSAQRRKLDVIIAHHRPAHHAEVVALKAKRKELMAMLHEGAGSEQAALALNQQITQEQSQLMAQRIDMAFDIKALLTSAQYRKMQGFIAKERAHHHFECHCGPDGTPPSDMP